MTRVVDDEVGGGVVVHLGHIDLHLAFVCETDDALPIVAEVQVLVEDDNARWVRHASISIG